MGTDHDTPSTDALFAPLQEAALTAYARTLAKGRPPRSPRALIHLAWLALLVWLGLGHLVTAAHRAAAVAAACPPGRKPKEDPQTSLLDVVTWPEDGRPGVFVSLVRLKLGNVRETCGQFVLSLQGCHVPASATAAAVAAGWGVLPEVRGNSEGLRFLPPSVVALYLAGNAASLARHSVAAITNIADAGESLPLREQCDVCFSKATRRVEGFGQWCDEHAVNKAGVEEPRSDDAETVDREVEPTDGPILTQADGEELRRRIADLTIGDFVKLTSGPHAGRIAGICSVSGDKPEASLVGRKVDVQDVTEVPDDAIDLIGEDPDEVPKPSQKSAKKSKSSAKRKGAKS